MEKRIDEQLKIGDDLFSKRLPWISLLQEIALNFYVERADFTVTRSVGEEFADHLMSSVPVLARRELGNQIGSMLRPASKDWFHNRTNQNYEQLDNAGKRWLEYSEGVMRRVMYDPVSQFTRATKEGDHDYAAFGGAVLSCGLNRAADAALFRCWHIRDVAWAENAEGRIDTIHRKWKPTNRDIARTFKNHSPKVDEEIKQNQLLSTHDVRHIVVPSEQYEAAVGKKWKTPFVSIFVDVDHEGYIMEEIGVPTLGYIIPRWVTIPGSQYPYSAATVAALPDARLVQAMTLTILEAGEKSANPPMVSVGEVIRGDYQLFAGGVTQVDAEYDERTGEALRPIAQDYRGLPNGRDMLKESRELISEAFYLNKLSPLPQTQDKQMTAFETGQRVQDYIRQALPLFEPIEMEYNGALCQEVFALCRRMGAFGPESTIPDSVRGKPIQFKFESPLHDAIEAQKGQKLADAKALIAQVADLDPAAPHMVDAITALRDALEGIGVPKRWLRSDQQMAAITSAAADAAKTQQLLGVLGQGANVAKTAGEAAQALGGLGAPGAGPGAAPAQQPTQVRVAA